MLLKKFKFKVWDEFLYVSCKNIYLQWIFIQIEHWNILNTQDVLTLSNIKQIKYVITYELLIEVSTIQIILITTNQYYIKINFKF